jgi:hypothetical protein
VTVHPDSELIMHAATAVLIGLGVGLHAAIWGVFKDSPHEGFHWSRFLRSPVIGVLAALELLVALEWRSGVGAGVLMFGAAYAAERFIIETWKTFFRIEDQSKYTIPMQLAVLGRPVRNIFVRWILGSLYFAGGFGVLIAIRWLGQHAPADAWPLLVLAASAGGWISAVGGAWKDAPIEGFETFKFFRSPLVALSYALLLSRLTPDLGIVMLAATGLTIATLETWKKFSRPNEPGGKFAGKPVHFPLMMHYRFRLVPLYAAICGTVALSTLAAAYDSMVVSCDRCVAVERHATGSLP